MSHDVDKCYYMISERKMQAFFEKISKKIFGVNCNSKSDTLKKAVRPVTAGRAYKVNVLLPIGVGACCLKCPVQLYIRHQPTVMAALEPAALS